VGQPAAGNLTHDAHGIIREARGEVGASRLGDERLVEGLLESLNESASSSLDPAWEAEIEKRLAEYDRGEVQAIDADVVIE
jgi:putative addiction module component (TIGR02574 family)